MRKIIGILFIVSGILFIAYGNIHCLSFASNMERLTFLWKHYVGGGFMTFIGTLLLWAD